MANVMICGMCSEEMGYSESKPCRACGFEFGMGRISGKKNLAKVSAKDAKAMAPDKKKTTSKKKHRVGAFLCKKRSGRFAPRMRLNAPGPTLGASARRPNHSA